MKGLEKGEQLSGEGQPEKGRWNGEFDSCPQIPEILRNKNVSLLPSTLEATTRDSRLQSKGCYSIKNKLSNIVK